MQNIYQEYINCEDNKINMNLTFLNSIIVIQNNNREDYSKE